MSRNSHQKRAQKRKAYRPGQRAKKPGQGEATAEGHEPEAGAFDIPDEILHAPEETSKLKYGLMILLLIFLLATFSIPTWDIFRSHQGADSAALRWTAPDGARVELTAAEFDGEKRAFANALAIDVFAGLPLGLGAKPTEEDMVRLLVLDRLAADAGLVVTDLQVAQHLKQMLEFNRGGITSGDLQRMAAQFGGGVQVFEETVRRLLRAGRYLQLMGNAGALPDPAKIEELWNLRHEEYAYDYVQLLTEDLKDEARGFLPESAELEAWFDALPEEEREALKTPARRVLKMASFRDADTTPAAALVAAYPEPDPEPAEGTEEEDPAARAAQRAKDYYNRVFYRRFAKPKPEPEPGQDPPLTPPGYFSEDELGDRLAAEAPVYFAMQRWVEDLQDRKAGGEEIDFVAEAEGFGLEVWSPAEPVSREALAAEEWLAADLGKNDFLTTAFQTPPGDFGFSVVLLQSTFGAVFVQEETAPMLPPFAEIQDKVADLWVEPKALELAEQKLQALWETFATFEPEEQEEDPFQLEPEDTVHRRATEEEFRQAVEAAGYTLGHRGWLDKGARIDSDPNWQEPANRFLATQRDLQELERDEVAAPRPALDDTATYLVRMFGKRPVPLTKMKTSEYESFKTQARSQSVNEVQDALDYAYFEKAFRIEYPQRKAREETEAGTPAATTEQDS